MIWKFRNGKQMRRDTERMLYTSLSQRPKKERIKHVHASSSSFQGCYFDASVSYHDFVLIELLLHRKSSAKETARRDGARLRAASSSLSRPGGPWSQTRQMLAGKSRKATRQASRRTGRLTHCRRRRDFKRQTGRSRRCGLVAPYALRNRCRKSRQ